MGVVLRLDQELRDLEIFVLAVGALFEHVFGLQIKVLEVLFFCG